MMRHQASLIFLLAVFWLANSGHFTITLLVLGVLSIVVVVFFSKRMKVIDHEAQPLHLFPHIFVYWGWLLKEIVVANIDVTYRIWRGSRSIEPTRLVLQTSSHTDVGKVILANSITLTPGTVTLDVNDDDLSIHTLSQRSASGLASLDRRVSKLET